MREHKQIYVKHFNFKILFASINWNKIFSVLNLTSSQFELKVFNFFFHFKIFNIYNAEPGYFSYVDYIIIKVTFKADYFFFLFASYLEQVI